MNKLKTLLFIATILFSGCAKIEFEDPAGNKATYSRVGFTKLSDVHYENNGVILKVKSAHGDAGVLGNVAENASETALNLSKKVP